MARCVQMSKELKTLRSAGLTQRQVDCLALHYFAGLRHAEVASRLGISRQAVTTHIDRGLGRLRAVGLEPSPPEMNGAKLIPMDPRQMDRLGPADMQAVW